MGFYIESNTLLFDFDGHIVGKPSNYLIPIRLSYLRQRVGWLNRKARKTIYLLRHLFLLDNNFKPKKYFRMLVTEEGCQKGIKQVVF